MKARKREPGTGTPWPEPSLKPQVCYVVAVQDRHGDLFQVERGFNVEVMMETARRKEGISAVLEVMTAKEWDSLPTVEQVKQQKRDLQKAEMEIRKKERERHQNRKLRVRQMMFRPTFDLMRPTAKQYQKIKDLYLSGRSFWWLSDSAKKQFDAFRPQRHYGPMACEVQTEHKTVPIHKQKWRPIQTGFSITEAAKILEHQDDIYWDHQ